MHTTCENGLISKVTEVYWHNYSIQGSKWPTISRTRHTPHVEMCVTKLQSMTSLCLASSTKCQRAVKLYWTGMWNLQWSSVSTSRAECFCGGTPSAGISICLPQWPQRLFLVASTAMPRTITWQVLLEHASLSGNKNHNPRETVMLGHPPTPPKQTQTAQALNLSFL